MGKETKEKREKKVKRPKRVKISTEEAIRYIQDFPKRKEKFIASVRKNQD